VLKSASLAFSCASGFDALNPSTRDRNTGQWFPFVELLSCSPGNGKMRPSAPYAEAAFACDQLVAPGAAAASRLARAHVRLADEPTTTLTNMT
jgi:hypothetical protein